MGGKAQKDLELKMGFPRGKKMNKLQALLIAGLLSLTSVSFATSLTSPGTVPGSLGYIDLVDDGNSAELIGGIAANSSVFYELGTSNINSGIYAIGNATQATVPYDLFYTIYNSLTFTAANIVKEGVNSIQVAIAANTPYYLQLTNKELSTSVGYGVTVSAVPVPAAGILFASALLGAGALGRRKKKAKASVVGAFARVS